MATKMAEWLDQIDRLQRVAMATVYRWEYDIAAGAAAADQVPDAVAEAIERLQSAVAEGPAGV